MARQRYDIGSHWLLHNQGKGALRVGGLTGVRRIEPMPGEITQSRKYPDGLLRAYLAGQRAPQPVLVEVATFAEPRALKQALDDLALAYSALGRLPELLMLVLRPKGTVRIGGRHEVRSHLGLSRLTAEWKVVELWTLPAEEFLSAGDVGVVPWVPLMHFDGPPDTLLERCATKIEREAPSKDRADLLAVTQVLAELKFPQPELLSLLGGQIPMLESPMLTRMLAGRTHDLILDVLKDRFGTVPRDVTKHLREVIEEKRLRELHLVAIKCRDLQAFRDALLS
ncbi:MAG TPA: hypothetical protein VFW33_08120 [Gemmataceae bacterium]|nr:hypothetical protein [Gemmataceae bacterium]